MTDPQLIASIKESLTNIVADSESLDTTLNSQEHGERRFGRDYLFVPEDRLHVTHTKGFFHVDYQDQNGNKYDITFRKFIQGEN